MRKCMAEDNIRDLVGDAHALSYLEKEWDQLKEDREMARSIFPKGDSKVCLYYNSIISQMFTIS